MTHAYRKNLIDKRQLEVSKMGWAISQRSWVGRPQKTWPKCNRSFLAQARVTHMDTGLCGASPVGIEPGPYK
jgi:hypothetical protein